MSLLRFKETLTPGFPQTIPGDIDTFIRNTPFLKRFTKYLKRHLLLWLTRQTALETQTIPEQSKRILWINLSSPSPGDTLMDLAGRSLLGNREITLLTDPFTVQLYQSDHFFQHATADPEALINRPFDHVLIDSYGTKGIRTKLKLAANTPFSGMYGFFDGPEINKVLFSYFRINYLLGSPQQTDAINQQATTHIYPGEQEQLKIHSLKLSDDFITIAVGGEWDHRVYSHWAEVIQQLPETLHITLIGSNNGTSDAQNITYTCKAHAISNFVGELSIMETTALISKSQLLICADGGLMHIAHGVMTPTITLFATVQPKHFTTNANQTVALFDDVAVRNIPPADLVTLIKQALSEQGVD